MLESVKISRRQSEIRQQLAELAAKPEPTDDETRSIESLDSEYRTNETRYRAALIAEDQVRREAGAELETHDGREWSEMVGRFELRQVAQAFAEEGRALDGATAEIVTELRSHGSYRGIPVPLVTARLGPRFYVRRPSAAEPVASSSRGGVRRGGWPCGHGCGRGGRRGRLGGRGRSSWRSR